jgi:hypothetical protein
MYYYFESENNTHEAAIAEQISVLYGLHILRYCNGEEDAREHLVYQVLDACTTEDQMVTVLHDVKANNETLNDMLVRKGLL